MARPVKPDWAKLIKKKRLALKETQTQFGKRFGVSQTSVSYWELGEVEAPSVVTWFLFKDDKEVKK